MGFMGHRDGCRDDGCMWIILIVIVLMCCCGGFGGCDKC